MSLERRLLTLLLLCAPLVWGLSLLIAASQARHEVNELFDTEMIRLAREVQATLRSGGGLHAVTGVTEEPQAQLQSQASAPSAAASEPPLDARGEADVRDLAIAVWDRQGRLQLVDREGVMLPRFVQASGFRDLVLGQDDWRVYYLQSHDGSWLVAAGQKRAERDELVLSLTLGQLLPWVMMLPVLLGVMVWAVRRALAPLRELVTELQGRSADALQPLPDALAPSELRPMVTAMNGLFLRIDHALAHERAFTADAAHELRTPVAVLRAQWDVLCRSQGADERARAETRFGAGLDRLDRLVNQMLALSRIEGGGAAVPMAPVDWGRVIEQAVSDCLPLAERRGIEIECVWPPDPRAAWPLRGNEALLTVMLRNLVDNAARYAPTGTTLLLRLTATGLEVENDAEPLASDALTRLGERFFRPDGQDEVGSGLGLPIVRRVASLHGLLMSIDRLHGGPDGRGLRVRIVSGSAGGGGQVLQPAVA